MTQTRIGTVLVTGGAGFIGCALSNLLGASADRWVVLDNLHPQVHSNHERPHDLNPVAELIVGDVADPAVWDEVLASIRPDVVIHLAAETGTAQSLHEATRHSQVNVVGTTEMLDALGRASHVPKQFVLSSSRAVYGEGEWQRPDGSRFLPGQRSHGQFESGAWDFEDSVPLPSEAERTWPAPTSVYGATKLAQEHILTAWAGSHDTKVSILRFQNVYGPGQSLINPYTGIVSFFSQKARAGEAIPIYEDGRITRDFVYIADVASSVAAVITQPTDKLVERYDVGSGVGTTILELARIIARYHDAPEPVITGAYRDGDVRHAECDISRTTETFDWAPEWNLERGIAGLQDWIEAQLATSDSAQ